MAKYTSFHQCLKAGPLVTEFTTGEPRMTADCNMDISGNYRAKEADKVLHDQTIQRSKFRRGTNWVRAYEFF